VVHSVCSIAHCIICTRLFRVKMHSDWFNGIEILQGRGQHGEKVGYCYPSGLEKALCKWDIQVPLVTKGLSRECLAWRGLAVKRKLSENLVLLPTSRGLQPKMKPCEHLTL